MSTTEKDLRYPTLKADTELCRDYLSTLCNIVWDRTTKVDRVLWNIPPEQKDWDMQFSALINEVEHLRKQEETFKEIIERVEENQSYGDIKLDKLVKTVKKQEVEI